MQFLYPTYLWALLLVLIPVLIHLFQLRRYKIVYFSSLKFLKQLDVEQKKKSRLRELLLLIVRILLISMLVLAFAHPYFPGKTNQLISNQTVGFYLDNSLSMENEAEGQSLFDHAKKQAIETAANYPSDTRFFLLHNEDIFASKYPLEKNDLIRSIELLNLSSISSDLGQVMARFNQILEDDNKIVLPVLYVFSDFQSSFIKPEEIPDSLSFTSRLINLPKGNSNNIFIDSCWFNSPVQNVEKRYTINARIINSSERNLQRFPVSLLIGDSLVAQETINLEPYATGQLEFSYNMDQRGWHQGKIEIKDYPLTFDNIFHFAYHISEEIPVLQIFSEQENTHLKALFESDPYFEYFQAQATAIPYQDLKRFKLIVANSLSEISVNLQGLLTNYVNQGGSLLVLPPSGGRMTGLNLFLKNLQAPAYSILLDRETEARIPAHLKSYYDQISMNPDQQVEWPVFFKYYKISDQSSTGNSILTNESGSPLLSRNSYGNGYVTVSAAPFADEFTNFHLHPLFVPLTYYLANTGVEDQQLYSRIGDLDPISLDIENVPGLGPVKLSAASGSFEAIPKQFRDISSGRLMIYLTDYTAPAGILEVSRNEGPEALIAINYAREESQIDQLTIKSLSDMIANYGWNMIKLDDDNINAADIEIDKTSSKTFSFIRFLLLLAIVLMIAESLIHRFKR